MDVTNTNIVDKQVLITGATSGIGEATAIALATMGAAVVIVGRDPDKTQKIAQAIRQRTQNPRVRFLLADLAAQADVRQLAAAYLAQYDHLDVLINNAGAGFAERTLTMDGIEQTWAVNHLAPFLLTNLLRESLLASSAARVITVTSSSHRGARIRWDDPNLAHGYSAHRAYGQSKLGNMLFTYELARRFEGTSVTANAVDPGPVATNLFKSPTMSGTNKLLLRIGFKIHGLVARPVEQGAKTIVYLAASAAVEGVTGKHWANVRVTTSSRRSRDEAAQQRLWALSERMTGLTVGVSERTNT